MASQSEENHKAVVADQTDMEQATVVAAQVRLPPAALPKSPPAKADVHFEGDDHVLVRYLSSIRDQAGVPTYGTKATSGMSATEVSNKFATVIIKDVEASKAPFITALYVASASAIPACVRRATFKPRQRPDGGSSSQLVNTLKVFVASSSKYLGFRQQGRHRIPPPSLLPSCVRSSARVHPTVAASAPPSRRIDAIGVPLPTLF